MLYQVFGRVPARTRQFVPFVQGACSRFANDEKFFCYANMYVVVGDCTGVIEIKVKTNKQLKLLTCFQI